MDVSREVQNRRAPRGGVWLAILCVAAISGCGGDSGEMAGQFERASASGSVKFKGQPIPAGSVVFTNVENGIQSTCPIDGGKYKSVRGDGPVYGKNAVNVVGLEAEGGTPLWSGVYSRDVAIDADTFQQDFDVQEDEVKPFKDIGMDEEAPLY